MTDAALIDEEEVENMIERLNGLLDRAVDQNVREILENACVELAELIVVDDELDLEDEDEDEASAMAA